MLGLRERMEDNDTAPPPRDAERSAAAPPDPEVVDKPSRRRFSPSYKLRIVEEADACTESGAVGRLLRREGLYTSHLTAWRKAARSGSLKALSQKRGRKPERNPFLFLAGKSTKRLHSQPYTPPLGVRGPLPLPYPHPSVPRAPSTLPPWLKGGLVNTVASREADEFFGQLDDAVTR